MLSAKQVFPFTYKPNEPKLTNGLYFPIGTPSFFDPYDVSHRDILTIQIQRYPLSGCWVIPHLLPYFHRNHTAVDAPRDHKMEAPLALAPSRILWLGTGKRYSTTHTLSH